jgi:hypothetical protein
MTGRIMHMVRRTHHRIGRWLLAWFALSIMAMQAMPVLHAQNIELLCSASGTVKVIVHDDAGTITTHDHMQDCSYCTVGAPPPQDLQAAVHPHPAARPAVVPAVSALTADASPFLARAPPLRA